MFGRRKPIESATRNESSLTGGWKGGPAAEARGPTLVADNAATDNAAADNAAADNAAAGTDSSPGKTSPETTKGPAMSIQTSSKPSSGGYVPDIPRRAAVDNIPGSPARKPTPRANTESKRLLVGRDISLSGEITACDVLVVEGTVQATLEQSQMLEVTDTGTFRGKVQIEEAVIAGLFEGTLTARDRLTVKSTGRINGTVRFGQLEVELGGVIKGDTGPLDQPIKDATESDAPKDAASE